MSLYSRAWKATRLIPARNNFGLKNTQARATGAAVAVYGMTQFPMGECSATAAKEGGPQESILED
jgi:hypothetical protein